MKQVHYTPRDYVFADILKFVSSWKGAVVGGLVLISLFGLLGTVVSQRQLKQANFEIEKLEAQLAEVKNGDQTEVEVIYEVSQGDTLWQLAEDVYGCGEAAEALAQANGIEDADQIEIGMSLEFPKLEGACGVQSSETSKLGELNDQTNTEYQKVTVEEGDSLWRIAELYLEHGNCWPELYELNKSTIGTNPDLIYPNQELLLPAREEYTAGTKRD